MNLDEVIWEFIEELTSISDKSVNIKSIMEDLGNGKEV